MKTVGRILIVILQIVAANLLGFAPAMAFGVGNGWELVVFALGFTMGVWGVGALGARLMKDYDRREQAARFVATLVFAALGVLIILVTPPVGFISGLYPLIGALLGYYLAPLFFKRERRRGVTV